MVVRFAVPALADRGLGAPLPRKGAGAGPEAGMQFAAARQAAGRLVPPRVQQRGLSHQAPREGLCAGAPRLFCSGDQAARVILDGLGQAVPVEVVLPDAVMDVEHTRQPSVICIFGGEALQLGSEALAPLAGDVRDDRERLMRGGDILCGAALDGYLQ